MTNIEKIEIRKYALSTVIEMIKALELTIIDQQPGQTPADSLVNEASKIEAYLHGKGNNKDGAV